MSHEPVSDRRMALWEAGLAGVPSHCLTVEETRRLIADLIDARAEVARLRDERLALAKAAIIEGNRHRDYLTFEQEDELAARVLAAHDKESA